MAFTCGLWLWLRHDQQEPAPPREAPAALPVPPPSPRPRVHTAAVDADARQPVPASPIHDQDAGADADQLVDEKALMHQMRQLLAPDPRQAEALAREGRRQFPGSPDEDERDMIIVAALYNQGDIAGRRREARYYFEHHPNGRFTNEVIYLGGVRPRPPRPDR